MVEHEILVTLAAPLLILARPIGPMLWALPTRWRPSLGRIRRGRIVAQPWAWLARPLPATLLHGAAFWTWHVPAFYEAALSDPWLHWLQHVSFFGTALVFWHALLQSRERQRGYGVAAVCVFATALHTGFVGVLLALARRPIYPTQTDGAAEWGLAPLEDQQLAGLIMWIPAGLVYAGAALVLAGLWIARAGAIGPGSIAITKR
jgi:cytochrome c oxidase assembly factor CtaG